MNLGITWLYSHVRQLDCEVQFVDLAFDDADLAEMDQRPPQILLLSLMIDDFAAGLRIIRSVKNRFPDTVVIVGGPHATLLGELVFRLSNEIDFVGIGDCLDATVRVIKSLLSGEKLDSGQLLHPLAGEIGDMILPDYSIWLSGRYFPVFPIEFSRGCRHRCPFCTDPVLRKGVKIKKVGNVLKQIHQVIDSYGASHLRFVDSSLTSLRPDLDELLEKMAIEELPVRWGAYAYPSEINEDLAVRLRKAGCEALFLGVESLSTKVVTGKRFSKDVNSVATSVSILRNNGIHAHCNFIIGLPGETYATAAETIRCIDKILPDSVGGGPFYLTPGSTFNEKAESFGINILDDDWIIKQHENFYDSNYEYFRTNTLTQREIRGLATNLRRAVSELRGVYWNMSDYAALCWLSTGGTLSGLKHIWKMIPSSQNENMDRIISVFKEKGGIELSVEDCRGFVDTVRAGVSSYD
jgi:radical SAM superfamily enzyme YgiQ (UPF0313 family)